jgi:hypothetical protein
MFCSSARTGAMRAINVISDSGCRCIRRRSLPSTRRKRGSYLRSKRRLGHLSIEESKAEENEDMPVEAHNGAVTPEQLCEAPELREMLSSGIGELKPILGKVVQLRELDEWEATQ